MGYAVDKLTKDSLFGEVQVRLGEFDTLPAATRLAQHEVDSHPLWNWTPTKDLMKGEHLAWVRVAGGRLSVHDC